MTREIADLIKLSRFYGANPAMVLAGGGNTSYKTSDRLFVKASGCALADVTESNFVELERARLDALLRSEPAVDISEREARFKAAIMEARVDPASEARPSVEAALHHLLPTAYVVHTHATLANILTCSEGGESIAAEIFGDRMLWVPYVDPGDALARLVMRLLDVYTRQTGIACPEAVLMANHGLIVCGETANEVKTRTESLLLTIGDRLQPTLGYGTTTLIAEFERRRYINTIGPALRGLLADTDDPARALNYHSEGPSAGECALKIVTFDDSPEVLTLAGALAGEAIAAGGPLTPDQIVYCKSFPLWFRTQRDEDDANLVQRLRADICRHKEATGFAPKVVIVQGLGLFAAGDSAKAADTVRCVYIDAIKVMAGARSLGGIRYMTQRDREFIDNWEVENYRRKVSAGAGSNGRAAGKVAIVTGAAQGFGAGIAADFAAEGAHVVLADVNAEGAAATAADLCQRYGPRRSFGVAMNVTEDDSVADAIHAVVRAYGGFDVFISNAGVLRAAGVKEQSQAEFDFVTRVNYLGYFTCVHHAAPVMAVQHLARPDGWTDIIQINSKSGLEGSNKNAAYAGSKFGGIGLTQSFALELIEDGIKVNSICPGNFLDGPLWSDPENGLFAQYLRTGKVPGATSVADVKRFYEAKVPMRRGCTVSDVMKAVYYVMEQQYETGQAVPVTGGQVMMR
ncbi:MAG TPA: SDR family NAD(P)-dependent oxidoreductase [Armatimonadota bacterium]|jgi:rhamnose utilization protein RhaD (predicted bifunctional aldolase and dehydrogenase)/NAD(P)-dependent dehydrogenase (short-subunit alcohol dehydrogenase family)